MKNKLIKMYNKWTDVTGKFEFTSGKLICDLGYNKYKVLAQKKECEELRAGVYRKKIQSEKVTRKLPETYIAELRDAIVFGENELVLSKKTVVSDIFTNEYADKMVLNKGIVKQVDLDNKEVVLKYHNYRKLPVKEAFCLVGMFSYSYYHFLVDLLPKLYYLYQCDEYRRIPLLIDNRAYQNYKTIIDAFNIHKRKIICVGANVAYKVKRLVMTSNCTLYDRYVLEDYYKDTGHVYDKKAIKFVREYALSKVSAVEKNKRVYISRKEIEDKRRRLADEEVVEDIFHKYGFITVCPEKLSFFEQVKLFSQTKIMAGVSGAAFTNIIFMPKDAKIICFTSLTGNKGENLFPSLWNTIGEGEYIILQGKTTEETKHLKDNLRKIKLDIQELEELLNGLERN